MNGDQGGGAVGKLQDAAAQLGDGDRPAEQASRRRGPSATMALGFTSALSSSSQTLQRSIS